MSKLREEAERIAREHGGDPDEIEKCLEEATDEEDYGLLDAIVDVVTAPICGGTAVIRAITERKKK